jgi:hypothetical protein
MDPIYPNIPLNKQYLGLIARLPVGFRELCMQGGICVELIHVLSRMSTVMSHKSSRSIPYNQKIGQYDDYLSVSSLHALRTPDGTYKSPSAILEALLSLGMILFSSTAFNEMRATPVIFRGPKDALYQHLLYSDLDPLDFETEAQVKCYQWIWAVSVDAWRDAAREILPQGTELLGQFYSRFASQWRSSDELVAELKRFFWTEDLLKFHQQSFKSFQARNLQQTTSSSSTYPG